ARERGDSAADLRLRRRRAARALRGGAAHRGPRAPPRSPPQRALGRRAAARRDRARARERPAARARRRAHGRPRQRERRGCALADGALKSPGRHHVRDGHARPARGGARAPHRASREGPARGRRAAMRVLTELARQTPLVVRQLRRNPRRTALTFFGLVIAFFLYTSLESLLYTMSHIVSGASRDALLFVRPSDPDYW